MIQKVLYDHLLAQADVVSAVATYVLETGGGSIPCIFTSRIIPEDAKRPAIQIQHVAGAVPFGCRAQKGTEALLSVVVHGDREMSDLRLLNLATLVWDKIDRANLKTEFDTQGYEAWGCFADYPQFTTDSQGFPMYIITVRVRVLQNAT